MIFRCDKRIRDGRKYRKCNEVVDSGEPTTFSVDGMEYAADLCVKHRLEFDEVLAPFIEIADTKFIKVGRMARKAVQTADGSTHTYGEIREWLRQEGYEVGAAGMVKQELVDVFKQAHAAGK